MSGPITITYLTGEYPPMQGGIADHITYLADYLAPLDISTSILTSQRWQVAYQKSQPTNNYQLPITNYPSSPIHPTIPNWGWRCWQATTTFLASHQPDILHIQYQAAAFDLGGWINWLPWYLKKRGSPTKIITTFHDLRIPYIFPKAGPFRIKSMLALARHSDGLICTDHETRQVLRLALNNEQLTINNEQLAMNNEQLAMNNEQLAMNNEQLAMNNEQLVINNEQLAIRNEKLEIRNNQSPISPSSIPQSPNLLKRSGSPNLITIPLGNNVEPQPPPNFNRSEWRAKYGCTDDTLLLAYFGFLNNSKGGDVLIEALALLRGQGIEAQLLLIGGDVGDADPTNMAYARKIEVLIAQHQLTKVVHRTGYVELAEVSASLLVADTLVMPYREGVSFRRTTLIAALRHGCPVVSTTPAKPNLIPEVIAGQNMLLATPNSAKSLAQTIAPLANDVALRKRLSEGALSLGELFEWEKIAKDTAEFYRCVVSI